MFLHPWGRRRSVRRKACSKDHEVFVGRKEVEMGVIEAPGGHPGASLRIVSAAHVSRSAANEALGSRRADLPVASCCNRCIRPIRPAIQSTPTLVPARHSVRHPDNRDTKRLTKSAIPEVAEMVGPVH